MTTATVVPLLTRTQHRTLTAIRSLAAEYGYSPTVREIAAAAGLPVSAAQYQIGQLAEKGWIRRHPNRPRAIVVPNPATGAT